VLDATALANISTRKAQTKLAFRLFKTFLKWCVEHKEYKLLIGIIQPKLSSLVEKKFGKNNAKRDALRRVQLESWFCSVRNILNPIISAALQVMLLIGARENEVLSLRWQNIDFELKEILIKDKVEGDRLIPLTPYVETLISQLPRVNEYVFASFRTLSDDPKNVRRRGRRNGGAEVGSVSISSKSGHISVPTAPHTKACKRVGIKGLSLHGLRRSFSSLTEWVLLPSGVVAQIMGHKPSAIAEKHYIVREPEILFIFHTMIEKWLLKTAKVDFDCPIYAKYQPLIEIDAELIALNPQIQTPV
jgi:integrase